MRHQLPDALGVVVVLPLFRDVEEVVNLRPLDVGSGATHQDPFAQRLQPRIHHVVVGVSGKDLVHLFVGAPVPVAIAVFAEGSGPNRIPCGFHPGDRELVAPKGDHHESAAAGAVRQWRFVRGCAERRAPLNWLGAGSVFTPN